MTSRTPRRFLPHWLGWWAILSGVGLVLSRAAWTNEIWLLPYGLFWLWVIIAAVLLLLRSGTSRAAEHVRGAVHG